MIEFLISSPIILAYLIFIIIDIFFVAGRDATTGQKLLWTTVVVFGNVIGLFVYAFAGRKSLLQGTAQTPIEDSDTAQANLQVSQTNAPVEAENQSYITQFQDPRKVRKITNVFGAIITVLAIVSGLLVVAGIILIALTAYACSRPGAKCM